MIHYCSRHPTLCWDDAHISKCPKCALEMTLGYGYLDDLRSCRDHPNIVVYDKDYGCPVCKINAEADAEAEKSAPPAPEQSLDDRIDELESRAKEIIRARAERELEKTGDHGRKDHGVKSGGFQWL